MATQQTAQRQVAAFDDAMMSERFFGVARARRIEAAIRSEHRTDEIAIRSNETGQEDAQRSLT